MKVRLVLRWSVPLLTVIILFAPSLAYAGETASQSSPISEAEAGPLSASLASPTSPLAGEQLQVEHEAQLANPEAVVAREVSRTEYEGLNVEQAAHEDRAAFPGLVGELAGGPPKLAAGSSIVGYPADDAAEVSLPEGSHAVLESMQPIALETSGGGHMPVDLSLGEVGGVFEPKTPVVSVRIPKRLSSGVSLGSAGVSLTPVSAEGMPLGGSEGVLEGVSVLYANTQTDADAVVKPTTVGFAEDTILRSVASPSQLYFRVGMPAGASLKQQAGIGGPVEVVDEDTVIATILSPHAYDAEGTVVPVSMSVSGDTLALTVEHGSGQYLYPIDVDPEVKGEDSQLTMNGSEHSNWEFKTSNGKDEGTTSFASSEAGSKLETYGAHEYKEGESAMWAYKTQGESKIYEFNGETEASNKEDRIESSVELEDEGTPEYSELLSNEMRGPVEYAKKPLAEPLCPKGKESCVPSSGGKGNSVHFQQLVVNKPTSKYSFSDTIDSGTLYISEPEIENGKKEKERMHSTVGYNTSSGLEFEVENEKKEKVKENRSNAYDAGTWLSEFDGALEFEAHDKGVGVSATRLEYESAPGKWEVVSGSEHNYLEEGLCKGIQCSDEQKEYWTLNKHLPNGEDKVRYRAEEAFGDATHETESLETEGVATVKVDDTKPHGIYLSGLPYGNELAEKTYTLTAYATDGEGSTVRSSGIQTIELYVEEDGKSTSLKTVNAGEGKCAVSQGECTASAKFEISGAVLGAGHHTIVIVAKDNAGNEGREEEQISIRHSTPVSMGPGSLDLESGDFALSSTDVSQGGGLTVSRVYSSRDLIAGEGGPLGPQWSISVGGQQSLVEMPDKSVLVTSATGSQTVFAAVFNSKEELTGKFEAPPGDSNLEVTLEENEKKEKVAYYLKDPAENTSTKFTPSSVAKVWRPTKQEGAVPAEAVTYTYETVEIAGQKITRPTEALTEMPGVKASCAPKLEPGCRALKFTYATKTKSEIGESESSWGEYEGRLMKVSYEGYNPATKKMTEPAIPVAEYLYDSKGRLRAEWDPRVSPALRTTYGYDEEGHVTALTPPGQQPWLMRYGTIPSDSSSGRLLSVTRPAASTPAGDGSAPVNTTAPELKIKGPQEGETESASNGTWNNSPLSYIYQWESCWGVACNPILGATDPTFTPTAAYTNQKLRLRVTAVNANGGTTAYSAESEKIKGIAPVYVTSFGKGTLSTGVTNKKALYAGAVADAVDSSGNVWVLNSTSTSSSKIYVYSPSGALLHTYTVEGVDTGIAINQKTGEVYVGDTSNQSIRELNSSGESLGSIWLEREGLHSEGNWISVAVDSAGNIWAANYDSGYLEEYNPSGKYVTEMRVAEPESYWEEHLVGIAVGNERVYAAVERGKEERPKVLEYTYGGSLFKELEWRPGMDLTFEPNNAYLYTSEGTTVYEYYPTQKSFNEDHGNIESSPTVKFGSEKLGEALNVAVDPANHYLYVVDHEKGEVEKWTAPDPEYKAPPPPEPGTNAVTTIEYQVPVSGSGAPHNMSAGEISKWDQKEEEAPEEATAIFPPDSPQNWPASSYTRATIYYMDSQGRVVNTATPSTGKYGAISTTEYNEYNDPVRTLSPDNRATALEAGEKSAEVASLLSTFNTYNGPEKTKCSKTSEFNEEREDYEPGTRLCETEGPAHAVKYMAGKEQKEAPYARSHMRYFYDEKVPAEGPEKESFAKETFDLQTESKSLTEIVNSRGDVEQEIEPRTTVTSYTGQNNLGWKLRKPTSVTVESEGAKTTQTTTYNENGQATETRGAGAESTLTYTSKFGEAGSEAGKLNNPFAAAVDSEGNIWVADSGNNRIEKYGPEGKYLSTFGKAGSGSGELKEPKSIAIYKGNLWVAESGNNRIQDFNTEGKSLLTFGKAGSGNGELKEPKALAIDSHGDIWVADTGNNRIEEFNEKGEYLSSFGKTGSGPGELKEPKGIAIDSHGNIWVSDTGNDRIQEFNTEGKLLAHYGEAGSGAGQFQLPFGITFDSFGHLWVVDEGNDRIQELSSSGAFIAQFGWKGSGPGQLNEPRGLAIDAKGDVWVLDTANNRLQEWSTGPNAHDSKTIYYGPEENKEGYPGCGKHPEWAGMLCETLPAKQPELAGLPKLPVTTVEYNIWGEPETTEEKFVRFNSGGKEETSTRKKKETYNQDGWLTDSETTATGTSDVSLPKVTEEYNPSTGELEKESTTVSGKTETVTAKDNTLGKLTEYIDSDSNVAKYTYAGPKNDGLLEEMSDSSGETKNGEHRSTQKYTYNETTKQLSELNDSSAGVFTASYDTEGKLTSEVYPNGMCANYTYNTVGEATGIEYLKTSNCSDKEAGVWFSESRMSGMRGEILSRTSTLSSETYSYDQFGRLTETQETPAGEGCTIRLYAYEEASNRVSSTTRKPGSEGKCATEGGTTEAHNYDEAGRLADPGIEYDSFGNIAKLPEADAEKHTLKSTFYIDNAVATQEQNGVKNEYLLDPAGRVRETITGTKKTISHYDAPGETVAWTCEKPTGAETCENNTNWTRNIPGIDGTLTATQTNGETPILQLHDLEGDIVVTIKDKPGETKLASTYNSTEFGVPNGKTPPPFAWLGAGFVKSELSTGVITYGATSYVPQTGRPLQSEAVAPPGIPNGSGGLVTDTNHESVAGYELMNREGMEAPGKEAGREEEAAIAAAEATVIDPEGLITGKEALELAKELKTEKQNLYIDNVEYEHCENTIDPSACEEYFEAGEKNDPALAGELEECYRQVHNATWVRGHYVTKTCLLDYTYTLYADNRVVEGYHVDIACFSYHVGGTSITYSTSEWYCEDDKKWWTFFNRGFWEKER